MVEALRRKLNSTAKIILTIYRAIKKLCCRLVSSAVKMIGIVKDRCGEILDKGKRGIRYRACNISKNTVMSIVMIMCMATVFILGICIGRKSAAQPKAIIQVVDTYKEASHEAAKNKLASYTDSKDLQIIRTGMGESGVVIGQYCTQDGKMGTILCNSEEACNVTNDTQAADTERIIGRRNIRATGEAVQVIMEEIQGEAKDDKQAQLQELLGENAHIVEAMKCKDTTTGQNDYWAVIQGEKRYTVIVSFIDGVKVDTVAYEITE